MPIELDIVWGDGEHRFALPIGQLRELQDKCKAGPARIFSRLASGDWLVDDVREILRLGLIGGGKAPTDAHILVVRYFDQRPPLESLKTAQAVLGKALVGDPEDPVGKAEAEEAKTSPQTTGSPSPQSTPGEQP